jgi:CrcB protein
LRSHALDDALLSKLSFHRVGSRVLLCVGGRILRRLQLQKYLFIAFGGALGSLARYAVGSAVASRMGTRFYYGTFVVNMTACLIIGFSLTWLGRHPEINPAWRFLIPIGFIGAYSTFSTFEWETFIALETGAFLMSALYVTLSVLLGLIAVWLGALLARIAF